MRHRRPAVAGRFYSGSAPALRDEVESFMHPSITKVSAKAIVAPHAGYIFSGGVAGLVYSTIEPPDTFVLMGPNHTGLGHAVSVMSEGKWDVPGATLDIDSELAESIIKRSPICTRDEEAHKYEHSLEVQLPFIVHVNPKARIVPITIMQASLDELMELGRAVAAAVKGVKSPVVIASSTDMSHFLDEDETRRRDKHALDKISALDPEGLYKVVRAKDISMCGFMPTVVALSAAIALGATEARLLRYTTSAEASGDFDRVVGYAGYVIV